jgi:replicative DNA helicase
MAFFTEEGQQFEKDDRFALDFDDVKRSLSKVKRGTGGWFVARCPAHNDNNPSLAFIKSGNTVGFHCFSGCGYESIVRALGMWKDTPKKKERINSKIAATYDYRNEAGVLKYQVVRFEPKHFSQRRPDGEGKWIWDLDKVPRLLYKLPELLNPSQEPVFIVEGEKDVDNLTKINAIATTNSGGATKWEKSFNKYFEGRDVIIIADKDDIGYDHAEIVSKEIYRSAKTVKIVQLDVKDVSVYLEEGNTLDDLLYLCREIAPLAYTEEDLTVDPSQSHNLEAEMALLGAILANPILIGKAVEAKLVDHYFNKKTKAILTAMIECFEASQDINYITVGERFPRNDLERLGGYDFLKSLENNLPTVFDADSWINIIVAKSQYRELATIGKKLTTLAETEAHSVDSLANTVLQSVHNIKTSDKKSKLSRLGDSLEGVIISAREAVGKGLTGLSTGFTNLDYLTSGLQRTDLIILAGRPSMGKCLENSYPVLTPTGWTTMGELKVGDYVVGSNGFPTKVTGVFPQGKKPMYDITFYDGVKAESCDEHLWFVQSREDRKAKREGQVLSLKEINKNLRTKDGKRNNYCIPYVAPIQFETKDNFLHPYLLGALIGDGSLSKKSIGFTNVDEDIVKRVKELVPKNDELRGNYKEYRISRRQRNNKPSDTRIELERLKLNKNADYKFIPMSYLYTSKEDRIELLRGLLDTDGCIGKLGWIEYSTISKQLAEDVRELVLGLGGRCTVQSRVTKYSSSGIQKEGKLSYRVRITFPAKLFNPFYCARKAERFEENNSRRQNGRYITSIEYNGDKEATCITVDAPDKLFVIKDYILTHNSAIAMNIAANAAIREKKDVAVFSLEMSKEQLISRVYAEKHLLIRLLLRMENYRNTIGLELQTNFLF